MRKVLLATFTALFALSVAPSVSQAQMVCGDRTEFVSKLQKSYAEKQISLGLASNGTMIEVFASEHGTFSIVITQPSGKSCLVAAGDNWQNTPVRKAEAKI